MDKYSDALDFLYSQLPMFQRIGASAYKAGLETSLTLSKLCGDPHKSYKTIHVAGTNGKGSVSHTLASILQKAGYKVGLYTSPHLIDFRERIRVNGEVISKESVLYFVNKYINLCANLHPSFFELTMMMAFEYFRDQNIDVAIIEVGLGGRLDSTNIITPDMCIITNISFDHTQFLGNTLPKIASEKAGIIKKNIPVVIGEATGDVRLTFQTKAREVHAPIIFAEDRQEIVENYNYGKFLRFKTNNYGLIDNQLTGDCQLKNANTILNAIRVLQKLNYNITLESVKEGFRNVCDSTGLMGRWMEISENPHCVCDTGHNTGGITYLVKQLERQKCNKLRIVIGFVNDKDISHILDMMPKYATYYFTQASIPRALSSSNLKSIAIEKGLNGESFDNVKSAYIQALKDSHNDDFVFIGGSTFIVADLLAYIKG